MKFVDTISANCSCWLCTRGANRKIVNDKTCNTVSLCPDCIKELATLCKEEADRVDWSLVPPNKKVLVRNFDNESYPWEKCYFAEVDNIGQLTAFADGKTSWNANGQTVPWRYMKLWTKDDN